MNLLILGRGKTGSLVAEVARERRHDIAVLCSTDNLDACALTPNRLEDIDVVIDFTTPKAVIQNIEACSAAGKNMVVGTTGWYHELPRIRQLVEKSGSGLLYGANFSIGINLFFDIARIASAALRHGYFGQVFERHHAQKKDAPSGTALALQRLIHDIAGTELEITSFREGDVVGMHELIFDSPADRIYLCHDAKSRRGYAEGAVKAAEWLLGKKGLFDFKDIAQKL
jgi:4-hydroxy-tetrahydrodipicolinate reductase